MKRAFWAASAAIMMLAGCGMGPKYPSFANAAYRVEAVTTAADTGQQLSAVIYRDGPKMRVESQAPGAAPSIIVFDQATNAAYLLQDATPPAAAGATPVAGTTQPTPPSPTPSASPATPAANPNTAAPVTPPPPASVGVAIRVADAQAPQPIEAAWAALGPDGAKSVGDCTAGGENGHDWQPKEDASGVQRTACITDDGIVLRVREGDRVLYEVTRLSRGAPDPKLFGIPPGYTLVDPAAAVQSVGATIGQLDSVQGAPQQPVQAPQATTRTP